MSATHRLRRMEPTTTRKIAGEVVRNLVGAKYGEYQAAPDELGMSLSTLYRLMDGETVRPIQYRKIERALDLPTPLLDYIVAGNTTAIEALDMDAALRQFILASLRGSSGPARRRRTDG